MTNRTIKCREQPTMGWGQDDEMPAGLQVRDGALQLTAVVFNMLEDIDVDNRIKLLLVGKLGHGGHDNLTPGRKLPRPNSRPELFRQLMIRFKAYPAFACAATEELCRAPPSSPDL
jgi:hypothetical protein